LRQDGKGTCPRDLGHHGGFDGGGLIASSRSRHNRGAVAGDKTEGEECAGEQESKENRFRCFHGAVCSPTKIPECAGGPLIDKPDVRNCVNQWSTARPHGLCGADRRTRDGPGWFSWMIARDLTRRRQFTGMPYLSMILTITPTRSVFLASRISFMSRFARSLSGASEMVYIPS